MCVCVCVWVCLRTIPKERRERERIRTQVLLRDWNLNCGFCITWHSYSKIVLHRLGKMDLNGCEPSNAEPHHGKGSLSSSMSLEDSRRKQSVNMRKGKVFSDYKINTSTTPCWLASYCPTNEFKSILPETTRASLGPTVWIFPILAAFSQSLLSPKQNHWRLALSNTDVAESEGTVFLTHSGVTHDVAPRLWNEICKRSTDDKF